LDAWDPNDHDLRDALVRGITPQPRLWFDEWADLYGIVRDAHGRKRRWSTDKAPFLRRIMRLLDPKDPTEEIVLLKPSQIFATTLLLLYYNFRIDTSPCTMIHAMPDQGMVEGFSRTRLAISLADCDRIAGKIAPPKSRDSGNTIDSKLFDGGSLELVGCNNPATLSSTPAGFVDLDEADRVVANVRKEGDPWGLLKARMKAQEAKKGFMASSPAETETSRIEPAYLGGTRELYYVPCPLCEALIDLQFRRILWPEIEGRQPLYRCQACDDLFDDSGKAEIMGSKLAAWIAMFPDRRVASFRLNGLYSPIERWDAIDAERREALASRTTNKLIVHINTTRAETYDARKAAKVDASKLEKLAVPIEMRDGQPIIPPGVGVLNVGTDTQAYRLEVVLYGWGKGEEEWHLDRRIFRGDTSFIGPGSVWEELDAYLADVWVTAAGRPMRVSCAGIDYRGRSSATVADFTRSPDKRRRNIFAVAGSSTPGRKVWPKKPSKSSHGTEIYTVGINAAKEQFYAALRRSVEAAEAVETLRAKMAKEGRHDSVPSARGPGLVHIAAHIIEADPKYLPGLTAEVPIRKMVKSVEQTIWEHPGDAPPNEPLDCRTYGFCAMRGWREAGNHRRLDLAVARANQEAGISSPLHKPPHRAEIQIQTPAPPRRPPAPPRKTGKIVDPFNTP
jgi:phage terminase large subunit GpA-like protein